MIARLYVHMPFALTVPSEDQFRLYEYDDGGYIVTVFPPGRSDASPSLDESLEVRINGLLTFEADTLRIHFRKESFQRDRNGDVLDPPVDIIEKAINSFLLRVRHVTRSPRVHPLDGSFSWRIQYLNDDETDLPKDDNLYRGKGGIHFSVRPNPLTPSVWEDVNSLPADYSPPPWEELILEAHGELPRVGPAVVLALTALEVLIGHILNELAQRSSMPMGLWNWINDRNDYARNPSLSDQYDFLLHVLTGHSLKEEAKLWESFKNLSTARNKFVHEGIATIGDIKVSPKTAEDLVTSAAKIIAKVHEWIPEQVKWPVFEHRWNIEVRKRIGKSNAQ